MRRARRAGPSGARPATAAAFCSPDPEAHPSTELLVPVHRVPDGGVLLTGFATEWLTAAAEGVTAELVAGAGLGNPYVRFTATVDGRTITEWIDIRVVFRALLDSVIAEVRVGGPADEPTEGAPDA